MYYVDIMPPARQPWIDDDYLLKATAGRAHPPSAAFFTSMTGPANMLAAANHWLGAVLGHRLERTSPPMTDAFLVPGRLVVYIFLPWMLMDSTSDNLTLPFFPLPSAVAKFLYRLIKAGMPSEKVVDERAARELVGLWAAQLPRTKRTFDAASFVQVATAADNHLMHITPPMARTTGDSNQEVATLLCLLQQGFADAYTTTAAFTAYCSMLIPIGVPVGAPPALIAIRTCGHVRSTTPDAPLDIYVPFNEVLSELTRRHEPTESDRFRPLFNAHYAQIFTVATTAFPQAQTASAMRQRLAAFAVALGMKLEFTHIGVAALCSIIHPQLASLEVDAPTASSADEERFAALLRLHKDQPGGRIASTGGDGQLDGKGEAGENMKLLLADVSYMALYQQILALNTTSTSMATVVAAAAGHEHPAGLIIMTSKRMLRQPAWEHVLGFRQVDAWQQAFDTLLAVDAMKNPKPHWGKMLPTGKDESPTFAILLLKHKLNEIPDWHALCKRHVEMNEGAHVLADPRYAYAEGYAFWLNSDILRLDEDALIIIFGLIGHGQSRSVQGSFRHFLFHQTSRAERIRRLPHHILAYPSLLRKIESAMHDVLNGVTERHSSMAVRAFHLMQRALFVPKGSQAEKSDNFD